MDKNRLENLTDGVFAIVFTILVLEIRVPELHFEPSAGELWSALASIGPLFGAYLISFVVLTMFWIGHHSLYHFFVKNINRQLILLNLLYLMFIALIPFSAHLIGTYPTNQTAVIFYGINMMLIACMSLMVVTYAINSGDIENPEVERRTLTHGKIRVSLPIISGFLGIVASFFYMPLSYFLFAFPIVFNIIPGSLNFVERVLGIPFE